MASVVANLTSHLPILPLLLALLRSIGHSGMELLLHLPQNKYASNGMGVMHLLSSIST
jgi:hypothetical protein